MLLCRTVPSEVVYLRRGWDIIRHPYGHGPSALRLRWGQANGLLGRGSDAHLARSIVPVYIREAV